MGSDLKFHSIYSVERIRQQHFTHSVLRFCKDSSPILNLLASKKFCKFSNYEDKNDYHDGFVLQFQNLISNG